MTSKLKCPVCQKPLEQVGTSRQYQCGTWGCNASFDMIGTEALWTALIQAKQDLVIAKSTLEYLGYEFAPESPEKNVIAEMRQKARDAVKYIEHKDNK